MWWWWVAASPASIYYTGKNPESCKKVHDHEVDFLASLRALGFSVRGFERNAGLGGVWLTNGYPGASTDSNIPLYQIQEVSLLDGWTWRQKFPGYEEIRRYFAHIDSKWRISKDYEFNVEVTRASFREKTATWQVTLDNGHSVQARWVIFAVGFASKTYTPPFTGMDQFRGAIYHTAKWPQESINCNGKRVAVIGTGASGVQVIQEIGPIVNTLTVYQRTPNLALPKVAAVHSKGDTQREAIEAFRMTRETHSSYLFTFRDEHTFDATSAKRRAFFSSLYATGNFSPWMATYKDTWYDLTANKEAYAFWVERTRSRITDPVKRDALAPLAAPHPFLVKRPALEEHYFEVFNQENVDLVDIKQFPILDITPTGIRSADGVHREFEVIILATGFHSQAGGLTQIDITGTHGRKLSSDWQRGARSYLGLAAPAFPNLFYLYGPQAPSIFTNATSVIALQVAWLCSFLQFMRKFQITRCEVTPTAEASWREKISKHWSKTLYSLVPSWYNRADGNGSQVNPFW